MNLDDKIFPEKPQRPYCAGFYLARPNIQVKAHFGDYEEKYKHDICPEHLRELDELIKKHYPEYNPKKNDNQTRT